MPSQHEQPQLIPAQDLIAQGYSAEVAAQHPANQEAAHAISKIDLIEQGYPPSVAAIHPANPDRITPEDLKAGVRFMVQGGVLMLPQEAQAIRDNREAGVHGN